MICQLLSTIKLASLFSQFSVTIIYSWIFDYTLSIIVNLYTITWLQYVLFHTPDPCQLCQICHFVNFDIVDSIIDYNLTIVDSWLSTIPCQLLMSPYSRPRSTLSTWFQQPIYTSALSTMPIYSLVSFCPLATPLPRSSVTNQLLGRGV